MTDKPTTPIRTRDELQKEIVDLKLNLPEVPVAPRIFLTDITSEALQSELADQGGRSSVITDEGNLFEILAGLYSGGRANLDVFLQGHAGQDVRVKRQGRQVIVPNIAVTLGLAVQPQVLADLRKGNRNTFRGKGLLARFLYCLPKSNIGKRDVSKRVSVPTAIKTAYFAGIKDLLSVNPSCDADGNEVSRQVTLDSSALEEWQHFSQWLEGEQGHGGKFESMQDFTGKLPGAALRIAGLCQIAEASSTLSTLSTSSKSSISGETMSKVIALCKNLIIHAQAAFDCLQDDATVADAKWVLRWIRSNANRDDKGALVFRENELHRTNHFKNAKKERIDKALDILHERHIISGARHLKTRKPTHIRYVNPLVMAASAGDAEAS